MCKADCVVCPCCNGKMSASVIDKNHDSHITYPRSIHFKELLTEEEYFIISRAADDENNYLAKCLIEFDRAKWAAEKGYADVHMLKMDPPIASPKHHIIYSLGIT